MESFYQPVRLWVVGGGVDILIDKTSLSSAQRAEVNCALWSEVRFVGTPNLATQPQMRALAQAAAEMSASGTASGHRDHLSTIVKM